MDVHSLIQDLMLVSAVSVDALIAAFSYGAGRIRIPAYSAFIISFICSLILTASIILSSLLGGMIPDRLCSAAGAGLLNQGVMPGAEQLEAMGLSAMDYLAEQ